LLGSEDNAACYFKLKETPGWQYGIWLEGAGYSIFGEHKELIDKFKPTRTYVSFEDDISGFTEMVQTISQNPKLYFVDSLTFGNASVAFEERIGGDETFYKGYQVVRALNEKTSYYDIVSRDESVTQEDYVNTKYEEYYREKSERRALEDADYKLVFDFLKALPQKFEEVKAVGVYDGNRTGMYSYPRYDVRFVIDENVDDSRAEELFEQIDHLIIAKNKERTTTNHSVHLYGCYDHIDDIKNCLYRYKKAN
jgi:hypothetical protein